MTRTLSWSRISNLIDYLLLTFKFWDSTSQSYPGWFWLFKLPASTSILLGLQVGASMVRSSFFPWFPVLGYLQGKSKEERLGILWTQKQGYFISYLELLPKMVWVLFLWGVWRAQLSVTVHQIGLLTKYANFGHSEVVLLLPIFVT